MCSLEQMLLNLHSHNEPSGSSAEVAEMFNLKMRQILITSNIWGKESKKQPPCFECHFSQCPRTGKREKEQFCSWAYEWERKYCTSTVYCSKSPPQQSFAHPTQCPILSMDIDLELERGRRIGIWRSICSNSQQNKPTKNSVKHKVKRMAVFNPFLHHSTLKHNPKHHTTPLPTHWTEALASLQPSQVTSIHFIRMCHQKQAEDEPGLQKLVFLASVSLG